MIADLQDDGKSPDEKQRFTIRRIILIIEDKWDIIIIIYNICIAPYNTILKSA